MGQTYLIINSAKRQFLDPGTFGENSKRSGVFHGMHATALALMVTDARITFDHELVGSWCGDPLSILGDYNTSEDPDDEAWRRTKNEFEDVSPKAIAMLCMLDDNHAQQLVDRASRDEGLFVDLGTVVHTVGCPPLEARLQVAFGAHWNRRYQEIFPKLRS